MFEIKEENDSIYFVFSSDMFLVDRVILECERHFIRQGTSAPFELKLVLRELLINAVEHGNQKLYERKISCHVNATSEPRCKLVVEDEGGGFDHNSVNVEMPEDPLQNRNRGYAMIHYFSERLEFNDTGNRITAYIRNARVH